MILTGHPCSIDRNALSDELCYFLKQLSSPNAPDFCLEIITYTCKPAMVSMTPMGQP